MVDTFARFASATFNGVSQTTLSYTLGAPGSGPTSMSSRQPHTQKYVTRLEIDKPKSVILETTKTDPADFLTFCPPTLESEDDVHCSAGGI